MKTFFKTLGTKLRDMDAAFRSTKFGRNWDLIGTIAKYAFSIILLVLASLDAKPPFALICGLELLLCFFITQSLARIKFVGWILSSIVLLLFNVQMGVMFFAGSFVTNTMLTNLAAAEDLSGNATSYILVIVLVVLTFFLPTKRFRKIPSFRMMFVALAAELFAMVICTVDSSPLYNYCMLIRNAASAAAMEDAISHMEVDASQFASGGSSIGDGKSHVETEENADKPNIVIVLTEGFSQSIVDDERNIAPNIREYEQKSLFFSNYYNHTFATYRGVIGQLYSGYQKDDMDANQLVSIQSILAGQGYKTTFINTEPNKSDWTQYCNQLGFQNVIGGDLGLNYEGEVKTISDKQAYEVLYDQMEADNKAGQPSLTVMYTFGTHVSLDSPNEKFGDGSSNTLNRFYNLDYQFGKFMEKFDKSPMAKNTIFVFTADHASYVDKDYSAAFPNNDRVSNVCSAVPFFIYYPGITPETIDANGRNTLDMAPTLLDYLGINADNYFLGASLLSNPDGTMYDTIFNDPDTRWSTAGGLLAELDAAADAAFEQNLMAYYALARAGDGTEPTPTPEPVEETPAYTYDNTYDNNTYDYSGGGDVSAPETPAETPSGGETYDPGYVDPGYVDPGYVDPGYTPEPTETPTDPTPTETPTDPTPTETPTDPTPTETPSDPTPTETPTDPTPTETPSDSGSSSNSAAA